ncbi:aminoacyl-histidine dipeptidase [uncultured Methanomethylovorans sp.]|jgi:dipeptidase D|uniref:aminoacyl-histidine dipeptidase n=1 Tax=uncultured Methanomethylovorans sp. TaxID=183759 RepID=UPI002608BAC7|nr:aminoacyl-histidine dipeptidase [uncultured Methanomethylovorans sp.]
MDQRTQSILSIFEQISSIPRCSKHEERIANWLKEWALSHGLSFKFDSFNNVVITVPPFPGYERSSAVVIQGHMDMVCEKTESSTHDFSKDPIKLVYDGDWLRADGTTLGADNGIALAMALELAQDRTIAHPLLELLFTVDEETSMQGVNALTPDFISGEVLLNLDSEEDGVFIVGCAGGITTRIEMSTDRIPVPGSYSICRLIAEGMAGGHSGVDIHEKRANANKVLAAAIEKLLDLNILLISVEGGKAHNAIPRYSQALLAYPRDCLEEMGSIIAQLQSELRLEYADREPGLTLRIEKAKFDDKLQALSPGTAAKLVVLLLSLPHGVASMSSDLPELVETSSNLATVKTSMDSIIIVTSQRSSDMEKLALLTEKINALARSAGATVLNSEGYPSWKPDMRSPLLQQCKEAYSSVCCEDPRIEVIHAGLECAVIGSKFVGLDMISFGPTIKNPHSPDERLYIPSVSRTWEFLVALLASFR